MGNLGDLVPADEDSESRQIRDIERRQQEEAAARRLPSSTIGIGGTLVVKGTLQVTGDLQVPAGALSSSGNMTAGVDVVAGRDVSAVRDVLASRDVAAVAQVRGDNGLFTNGLRVPDAYNRNLTGSGGYKVAYWDLNGQAGYVPSSLRFKQDVAAADIDPLAILSIEIVTYRYKEAVANFGEETNVEFGVIAEQVAACGLSWLIDYDEDGEPLGFKYERLAVGLLAVVQNLEARVATLEAARDSI